MKAIHRDNLKPSKEIGEDYANLIGREINCMGDGSIQPTMRPYLGSLTRGEEKKSSANGGMARIKRSCMPGSALVCTPTRLHSVSFLA